MQLCPIHTYIKCFHSDDWMVEIRGSQGRKCHGVLISNQLVLTSAECVYKAWDSFDMRWRVYVTNKEGGKSKRQIRIRWQQRSHDKHAENGKYGLKIIKLREATDLTPICISETKKDTKVNFLEAGFGSQENCDASNVNVRVPGEPFFLILLQVQE